jgi:hypothetical protein
MEEVIDRIISIVEDYRTSGDVEETYLAFTPTKFGDPGVVTTNEYPYFYVAPISDNPDIETIGMAGYDCRELVVQIGFVIDVTDYFDSAVDELAGIRVITQVMFGLGREFRRKSRKTLNDLDGVRNVKVASIEYRPEARADAFVMTGLMTLGVYRRYQHEG